MSAKGDGVLKAEYIDTNADAYSEHIHIYIFWSVPYDFLTSVHLRQGRVDSAVR